MSSFADDQYDIDQEEGLDNLEEVEVLDGAADLDDDEMGEDDEEGVIIQDDENDKNMPISDESTFAFRGHTDAVYCASIHPHNPNVFISGGGDDRAFLWKLDGCSPNFTLSGSVELVGHTDTVTAVGFNFNGSLALTGSYDGTVRIWDVERGHQLQILDGPEDVEWAQWHNKGNAIIAGSKDGTVWMWLAHNGQCMQVFAGHDGLVSCGLFSACGKFICTGGEDGTVRIWLPKTGACKHVFDHHDHNSPISCMAVGEDTIIAGTQNGDAKLYHVGGLRLLHTFVHSVPEASDMDTEFVNGVESVGLSSELFRWAATGGMDKNLKIWDISSGNCRVNCEHEGGVVSLKWHESLPFVCTGATDGIVRVWDARSGDCIHVFHGHTNMVTSVDWKFDSSGKGTIISVSDDATVRLFDVVLQQ